MALINVAIKFGDNFKCFQNFFSKIFFLIFFFKFLFPKFFFQNFFLKMFFLTFFKNFCFEGFTLDASPFTETKLTLCISAMKNMISKRLKLDFSLV